MRRAALPAARPLRAGLALSVVTALLMSSCAAPWAGLSSERSGFTIAVLGDMPYIYGEKDPAPILERYQNVLDDIDASNSAFVVHIGDVTNGPYCGDSVLLVRYREFDDLSHPFFYAFGDNEWTDCARGGFDPLERLARLREIFSKGDSSLGASRLPLERQSAEPRFALYRENVRWRFGNVMFVILNIPGSNNNRGTKKTPGSEYLKRNEANIAWLRETFAHARTESVLGVGIFIQAEPGFGRERMPEDVRAGLTGYDDFLAALQQECVAYRRPVALVHGDWHYFLVDKPLADTATGRTVMNFTRAETFGAANHHWLRMIVDQTDPNLFRFEPKIVAANE